MTITMASLIACGGGEQKESNAEKSRQEDSQEIKAQEKAKQEVEIEVIAKGETMAEIAFDPKSINVPAGSTVKLTLINESEASGMLHNFVLIELGAGQEIATAGIQAGVENEFVPDDNRVIVHTEVISMGETTTITFDAPPKGSYHYICTYPGHYPNMIGRLNVN
jgi:azurin